MNDGCMSSSELKMEGDFSHTRNLCEAPGGFDCIGMVLQGDECANPEGNQKCLLDVAADILGRAIKAKNKIFEKHATDAASFVFE